MKDDNKTREQLINKLEYMCHRIAELKKATIEDKKVKEALRESEEKYRELIFGYGLQLLWETPFENFSKARKIQHKARI